MPADRMGPETQGSPPGFSLKRLWPLAVLIVGFALFFVTGANEYISFEALRTHRQTLTGLVAENAVAAVLVYMLAYAAVVAFSLPGGAVMTILGGFLFGIPWAVVWVVIAATVGATLLFLAVKTSLGDALRARAGPALRKMEAGFAENALSYLLVLRLVPLFPFFIVNIAPAFVGMPLRTYVVGTFFGIIPGTYVYAQVGDGLGSIFDRGEAFSAAGILTPEIVAALIGLAVLSLIPVVYKQIRKRRGAA